MKQILIVAFAVLLITACQKNDAVEEDETSELTNSSLTGKWELRTTRGSMANCCDYLPGSGNILKFDGSQYEKYEKNLLTKTGSYLAIVDTTAVANTCLNIFTPATPNRLIYDSNFSSFKTFFIIKNGQLITLFGCTAADGGSQTYDRVK